MKINITLLTILLLLVSCKQSNDKLIYRLHKNTVSQTPDSICYFIPEEYTKIKGELYVSDMSYKGKYPIVDSTRKDSVVYFSSSFADYHKCYRKYPIADNTRKDSTVCMTRDSLVYKNTKLVVVTYFTINFEEFQYPYTEGETPIKDHFTANENYVLQLWSPIYIAKQIVQFYANDQLVKSLDFVVSQKLGTAPLHRSGDINQISLTEGNNGCIWIVYATTGNYKYGSEETMYYTTLGDPQFYKYEQIEWENVDSTYTIDNTDSIFQHLGISEASFRKREEVVYVADFNNPNYRPVTK